MFIFSMTVLNMCICLISGVLNAMKGIQLLFEDVIVYILDVSIHNCKNGFHLIVIHVVMLLGGGKRSNAPQV